MYLAVLVSAPDVTRSTKPTVPAVASGHPPLNSALLDQGVGKGGTWRADIAIATPPTANAPSIQIGTRETMGGLACQLFMRFTTFKARLPILSRQKYGGRVATTSFP